MSDSSAPLVSPLEYARPYETQSSLRLACGTALIISALHAIPLAAYYLLPDSWMAIAPPPPVSVASGVQTFNYHVSTSYSAGFNYSPALIVLYRASIALMALGAVVAFSRARWGAYLVIIGSLGIILNDAVTTASSVQRIAQYSGVSAKDFIGLVSALILRLIPAALLIVLFSRQAVRRSFART